MEMRLPVLLLLSLFLALFGCASVEEDAAQAPSQPASFFRVPESPRSYSAAYAISEGGGTSYKEVWRSGRRMRTDYAVGAARLSLFFLDDRAYSCLMQQNGSECHDITKGASQMPSSFFLAPKTDGAVPSESVKVGTSDGQCYLLPNPPYGERKFCIARGVLAYDEYSSGAGKRVEYATRITYGEPDPSVFGLPAEIGGNQ